MIEGVWTPYGEVPREREPSENWDKWDKVNRLMEEYRREFAMSHHCQSQDAITAAKALRDALQDALA